MIIPVDGRQSVFVPLLRDSFARGIDDFSSLCHDFGKVDRNLISVIKAGITGGQPAMAKHWTDFKSHEADLQAFSQ